MITNLIIRAMLMLAVINFVKDLPKEIGEITGIKSEGMGFGLKALKERLGTAGNLAAGGLSLTKGAFKAGSNSYHRSKDEGIDGPQKGLRAFRAGLGSVYRGGRAGAFTMTNKDRKEAVNKGMEQSLNKQAANLSKDKRYRLEHGGGYVGRHLKGGALDVLGRVKISYGFDKSEDELKADIANRDELKGILDSNESIVEDALAKGKINQTELLEQSEITKSVSSVEFTNGLNLKSKLTLNMVPPDSDSLKTLEDAASHVRTLRNMSYTPGASVTDLYGRTIECTNSDEFSAAVQFVENQEKTYRKTSVEIIAKDAAAGSTALFKDGADSSHAKEIESNIKKARNTVAANSASHKQPIDQLSKTDLTVDKLYKINKENKQLNIKTNDDLSKIELQKKFNDGSLDKKE